MIPMPPSRHTVFRRCSSYADCATLFVIREEEAAKKAEAARKKAEREALLAEEEKNTPGRSAPKNAKSAQKKTRGIDDALGGFDVGQSEGRKLATLNASGLDNALEALGLTNSDDKLKIDRHPERRVERVRQAWVKERMEELTNEGFFKIKGNTKPKKEFELRKEFDKRPENPLNQVHGTYNMTQEQMEEIRAQEQAKTEKLLAED